MSEICLDCWNKENQTNHKPRRYILSKHLELCDSCGEYKRIIVMYRYAYYKRKFRYIILPFKFIFYLILWPIIFIKNVYQIRKSTMD